MNIVLMGPPGSGKGTLAAGLVARLGLPHVSTGDALRQAMSDGTPLGESVRRDMDAGRFAPDGAVSVIVSERMAAPDASRGIILDGFPRTVEQAAAFDSALAASGQSLDAVLLLDASESTVAARLLARRQCRSCGAISGTDTPTPVSDGRCDECGGELYVRDDDRPSVVPGRLEDYLSKTAPVAEHYSQLGLLRRIDAAEPPSEVLAAALDAVGVR